MTNHTLLLFVLGSGALLLTPGPLMAYVVARTIGGGWRWGLWASLGICVGDGLHIAAALGGLGAIVAAAPDIARTLELAGAAYLILIGLRSMWLVLHPGPSRTEAALAGRATRAWAVGFEACMLNVVNVQAALFFMAFLPSFVVPHSNGRMGQLLLLSSVFCLLNVFVLAGIVGTASALRGTHLRAQWVSQAARITSSIVLIGLGGAALLG